MGEVRTLPGVALGPRESIVAMAKGILEKAERGEIISLGCVYEYADGDICHWVEITKGARPSNLVAGAAIMQHAIIRRNTLAGE